MVTRATGETHRGENDQTGCAPPEARRGGDVPLTTLGVAVAGGGDIWRGNGIGRDRDRLSG